MSSSPLPPAMAQPGSPAWTSPPAAAPGLVPLTDLSSPTQVTLLGFFAGPFAAVWLMARNFRRLHRPTAMWITLGLGVAATAAVLAVALAVPDVPGARLLAGVPVLAAWGLATKLQGAAYAAHVAAGGPTTRGRTLALIAVGALLLQVVGLVGVALVVEPADDPPHVTVAPHQEVRYRDGATRDDAAWLGGELTRVGYLTPGHPATVVVSRRNGRVRVGLVVRADAASGDMDDDFRVLARQLGERGFHDTPVDIELLDRHEAVVRTILWME